MRKNGAFRKKKGGSILLIPVSNTQCIKSPAVDGAKGESQDAEAIDHGFQCPGFHWTPPN